MFINFSIFFLSNELSLIKVGNFQKQTKTDIVAAQIMNLAWG